MTLRVEDTPAAVVGHELGRMLGIGCVMPKEAGDKSVSVSFHGTDGEAAFKQLAGMVGLGARFAGGSVEFVRHEDVVDGFAVVRSGYTRVADASVALRTLAGKWGTVTEIGDRVLVVGNHDTLQRVQEFSRQLEAGPDGWQLDVRVVRVSDRLRRELGIDWNVSAGARLGLDAGLGFERGAAPILGAKASAIVSAVASAAESRSEADLLYSCPLYVLEGEKARVTQGERVPVPRRTVSDQGTVTTVGYEYIDAGFELTASAKRVEGGVLLQLSPSLSSITGHIEGVPILSRSAVESAAVVDSGQWLVLGGLEATEQVRQRQGLPGSLGNRWGSKEALERTDATLLVLVRAVRVFSASPPPDAPTG